MIQVTGLSKHYGSMKAIDDVSFHVNKGEIVGFLGPNGAGKSTTMKILTCFTQPTSGTAEIAGFDTFENPDEIRKRLGYLPENAPLYQDMTPQSYLRHVAELKNVAAKEIKSQVEEVVSTFGVSGFSGKLIKYLSKGQKQRVGIAQSLLGNPEILILDEPTVGLDPQQIHEIRDVIRDMQGKRTVILSTHILPEVSMTCQRILIINKGKIVAEDSTKNLLSRFHKHNLYEIEVGGNKADIESTLSGINQVVRVELKREESDSVFVYEVETEAGTDKRREVSNAVVKNGLGLLSFQTVSLSLEEIFLELVTEEVTDPKEPTPAPPRRGINEEEGET